MISRSLVAPRMPLQFAAGRLLHKRNTVILGTRAGGVPLKSKDNSRAAAREKETTLLAAGETARLSRTLSSGVVSLGGGAGDARIKISRRCQQLGWPFDFMQIAAHQLDAIKEPRRGKGEGPRRRTKIAPFRRKISRHRPAPRGGASETEGASTRG